MTTNALVAKMKMSENRFKKKSPLLLKKKKKKKRVN